MRTPRFIAILSLLATASFAVAKTATTTKPAAQPHTTTPTKTTTTTPTTAAATAEVQLPVDPFTKIDSVLTGADADDLKAALEAAIKDDSVVKANKVYSDSLTKYQNATPGMKSSSLDSLKGSVKSLFAAEKSVILKANAKLAPAIDKVEKAK
ncbi:MAG: hypothetical protein WCP67_07630 [Verrucomicrobiota bacterium]